MKLYWDIFALHFWDVLFGISLSHPQFSRCPWQFMTTLGASPLWERAREGARSKAFSLLTVVSSHSGACVDSQDFHSFGPLCRFSRKCACRSVCAITEIPLPLDWRILVEEPIANIGIPLESMNDKGVCRTAPATPGLLKSGSLHNWICYFTFP